MAKADIGPTKPAAGVMATSPATAPEIAPSALTLPLRTHSAPDHPTTAAAAPRWVATKALVARVPEASALRALNPNQPTQSRQAVIDQERPQHHEQHYRAELHALGKCPGDQRRRDD